MNVIALILTISSYSVRAGPLPAVSNQLPFSLDYFQKTVASVQNTYCGAENNYEGLQIGDQTLVKSVTLPDDEQRVNIYTSDSLGLIVAYQGTNFTNMDSIRHNIMFNKVRPLNYLGLSMGAMIFDGWQDQFQKSWDQVKSTLAELHQQYPDKKVQVIGHSQGAALAQLSALAIRNAMGDVIDKIICYGPPRVGNSAYSNQFNQFFQGSYTGVTNGDDWVVNMPPRVLGFEHPDGLVWINPANSSAYEYFSDAEDPRGPNAMFTPIITSESMKQSPYLDFQNHLGFYMGTPLHGTHGPCPAIVG